MEFVFRSHDTTFAIQPLWQLTCRGWARSFAFLATENEEIACPANRREPLLSIVVSSCVGCAGIVATVDLEQPRRALKKSTNLLIRA